MATGLIGPMALRRSRYWSRYARQLERDPDPDALEFQIFRTAMPPRPGDEDDIGRTLAMMTVVRDYLGTRDGDHPEIEPLYRRRGDRMLMLHIESSVAREATLARALIAYGNNGAQNFEFGRHLVEDFDDTDVDDVECGEVNLPYDHAYYRFEGLEGTTLDGLPLDGFLISKDQDNRRLMIIPMSSTPPRPFQEWRNDDAGLYVDLERDTGSPFIEAAAETLRTALEQVAHIDSDEIHPKRREEFRGETLEQVRAMFNGMAVNLSTQFHRWMKLIVNGLLMIDGGGVEAKPTWQTEAPRAEVEKATSARTGSRKAEQRLRAQGYVTLLRIEIPDRRQDAVGIDPEGRGIAPHWRRGHWRRVHHGVGKALTRRVRIAPTIVNAAKGDPQRREAYRLDAN